MAARFGTGLDHWKGPALLICGMSSAGLGVSLAIPLITAHGALGLIAMQLACAAMVMAAFVRPRLKSFGRRQWLSAIALGAATACTMLTFFMAVARIPVGSAATIDFLGPLTVAVIALRGFSRIALPALAIAGIVAMTIDADGWTLDPTGVVFALIAGCAWATYIVFTRRVGALFSKQEGLCVSLIVAAAIALATAFVVEPSSLSLATLPAAAGLALLMPIIPLSCEMMAMRRMEIGAFSILMSLEPSIEACLGFLILGQMLSLQQILGSLAVVTASIGAVLLTAPRPDSRALAVEHECTA